jgi:hypothetical protein
MDQQKLAPEFYFVVLQVFLLLRNEVYFTCSFQRF